MRSFGLSAVDCATSSIDSPGTSTRSTLNSRAEQLQRTVASAGSEPQFFGYAQQLHGRIGTQLLSDDGLMVGTVNLMQTLELLFQLVRKGFDGVIYFDTFPDITGLDPVQECENNIAMVNALWGVAKRLTEQKDLLEAIKRQDAVVSQNLVRLAILGA